MTNTKNKNLILSYKALRRLIGILGMTLPAVCFLGGWLFGGVLLDRSISHYYWTNVRDFFVGLMIAVAFFLATYKGYDRLDLAVSLVAAVAGFGVAVFPCLVKEGSTDPVGFFQIPPGISDVIHLACASIFFVLLAVNSLFLFTKTNPAKPMGKRKSWRNRIYVACGLVILACLLALVVASLALDDATLERLRLVFIFETIMLEAFGISWLVKGETLFRDGRRGSADAGPDAT